MHRSQLAQFCLDCAVKHSGLHSAVNPWCYLVYLRALGGQQLVQLRQQQDEQAGRSSGLASQDVYDLMV